MAGAGTYSGFMVGTLDNYFAPILPHRVGTIDPTRPGRSEPTAVSDRCASAITIMYVPNDELADDASGPTCRRRRPS